MALSQGEVLEVMKDPRVVALNVLPSESFQELHIEGSWNIPLTVDRGAFAQAVEEKFGRKKFFVVYGSNITSHDGMDAMEALRKWGFRADIFLSGMKGWVEAGFPTAGTRSSQPQATMVGTPVLDL